MQVVKSAVKLAAICLHADHTLACYRSTKADVVQGEGGLHKQASHPGISRMTKTTRFSDRPAQQEDPLTVSLSQNLSGIPTGASAHWTVTRLMPWHGQNAVLLLFLAAAIIALQVCCMTTTSVPPVLTTSRTFASALCSAQQRMVGEMHGDVWMGSPVYAKHPQRNLHKHA